MTTAHLGYVRDQKEQLHCGTQITLVDKVEVHDRVFLSDASACKGSGDSIVNVNIHPDTYKIYVI